MTANTKIEWADHTFNPWTGCEAISPGCANCYAESWAKRAGRDFAERRRTKTWGDPVRWNAAHDQFFAQHGRRQRVFCASLADVFDNQVPEEWRADLFSLINATPDLDWLLLTKRIGNVMRMMSAAMDEVSIWRNEDTAQSHNWENVWLGATLVNREEMLRDAPKLKQVQREHPRHRIFWSVEPMLGPLGDIPREMLPDWVIVGGESGHHARPMHPDWPRTLQAECEAVNVPFFFKQWGEWRPADLQDSEHDPLMRWIREDGGIIKHILDFPNGTEPKWMKRVGKKAAGRLLDGREYSQVPE